MAGDALTRSRLLVVTCIATAMLVSVLPTTEATHNNKGTVKVHDEADADPDVRNEPHVSCDFWVEGFKMGDDAGWLVFYDWPPTGNKDEVEPEGDDLDWTADSGDEAGDYHFEKGPYSLPPGHYRVEAYTDDGHPSGLGHFAKAKMFWVDGCDEPCEQDCEPPCPSPTELSATSEEDLSGEPMNVLEWNAVEDADEYFVYRAEGEGGFEFVSNTTGTSYTDVDVEAGITYTYTVTAVFGEREADPCAFAEVTAVPFFGAPVLGAIALAGSVGAFVALRRRR